MKSFMSPPELFSHIEEFSRLSRAQQAIRKEILKTGVFPKGFDDWGMRHNEQTIAQEFLLQHRRPLPAHFDAWHLVNKHNQTVAHTAAFVADTAGLAVISFFDKREPWTLRDWNDDTVMHVCVKSGLPISEVCTFEDWQQPNWRKKSVYELAVEFDRKDLIAQYEALKLSSEIRGDAKVVARISRNTL